MVHVIAAIDVAEGKRDEFLKIFATLVPQVHAEDGCIAYEATCDVDSGIEVQIPVRTNTITVVEKWESLDALKAHLTIAHMDEFRSNVSDIVTGISLQILEPV